MKYFLHKSQVDYFTKHLGPDWVEDHCIIIDCWGQVV